MGKLSAELALEMHVRQVIATAILWLLRRYCCVVYGNHGSSLVVTESIVTGVVVAT